MGTRRDGERAGVGRELAGQHAQQRRLPGPVRAAQQQAPARGEPDRRVGRLGHATAYGDSGGVEQDRVARVRCIGRGERQRLRRSRPALAPDLVDAALEQPNRTPRSALASVLGRALAGLPVARSRGASGTQPLREHALGVETRGMPSAPLAQRPRARLAVGGKASTEQGAAGAECRVEVEDRCRDRVEQPAIVRHEHNDPRKLHQPPHKPVQRAVVEVVARLIQQQAAGRVSQCAGEPQAVALADREAGKRLSGVEVRIESVQRRLESPLGVPRAKPLGVRERGCVALAGALCARGEARGSDAERGQRVARRSQRLCPHRSDRRPGRRVHLLLDEGATLGRPAHVAAVGHEPACEQPQQRPLPAPLSPITARRCPAVTVSETPSSTAPSPNPLHRSRARRCDPGRESDGTTAPTICDRMTFLPEAVTPRPEPRREDLAGQVRGYRKLCGMRVMRHQNYHARRSRRLSLRRPSGAGAHRR